MCDDGNIFSADCKMKNKSSGFGYHAYWARKSYLWDTVMYPLNNFEVFSTLNFLMVQLNHLLENVSFCHSFARIITWTAKTLDGWCIFVPIFSCWFQS